MIIAFIGDDLLLLLPESSLQKKNGRKTLSEQKRASYSIPQRVTVQKKIDNCVYKYIEVKHFNNTT